MNAVRKQTGQRDVTEQLVQLLPELAVTLYEAGPHDEARKHPRAEPLPQPGEFVQPDRVVIRQMKELEIWCGLCGKPIEQAIGRSAVTINGETRRQAQVFKLREHRRVSHQKRGEENAQDRRARHSLGAGVRGTSLSHFTLLRIFSGIGKCGIKNGHQLYTLFGLANGVIGARAA